MKLFNFLFTITLVLAAFYGNNSTAATPTQSEINRFLGYKPVDNDRERLYKKIFDRWYESQENVFAIFLEETGVYPCHPIVTEEGFYAKAVINKGEACMTYSFHKALKVKEKIWLDVDTNKIWRKCMIGKEITYCQVANTEGSRWQKATQEQIETADKHGMLELL